MMRIDIDGILSELSLSPPVTTVTNLLPPDGNGLDERNMLKSDDNTSLLPPLPLLPQENTIPPENSINAVPDEQHTSFEQEGDPVSCPYWYRVCWAVAMYQNQCTRNTTCRVYQFLEKQESSGGG